MTSHYPSNPFHLGFEAFRKGKTDTPPANLMPTSKRKAERWAANFKAGYSAAKDMGAFDNEK